VIPAAMTLASLALAAGAGAGVAIPAQANADSQTYDFTARYDLLSPAGKKIGVYTSSVKGPRADDGRYEMIGQIEFSITALGTFGRRYSSIDSVLYDAEGIVRYEIVEIDNGKRTRVTGNRSPDGRHLYLKSVPAQVPARVIARASYDLSLYAFRFPLPCAQQQARELRILAPRTGKVDSVRGEPASVDTLIATAYGNAECRLITRDAADRIVKESWFLQDGMLAFETTPDYQLRLTGVEHGQRE